MYMYIHVPGCTISSFTTKFFFTKFFFHSSAFLLRLQALQEGVDVFEFVVSAPEARALHEVIVVVQVVRRPVLEAADQHIDQLRAQPRRPDVWARHGRHNGQISDRCQQVRSLYDSTFSITV